MGGGWQISAGDLSETARPFLFALPALASAWVLFDSRGGGRFGPPAAWAWSLAALALPQVFIPLYLAARVLKRGTSRKGSAEDAAGRGSADADRRLIPPLAYAAVLLTLGAAHFHFEGGTFDAHFARAKRARLYGDRVRTIREYRAALGARDDPHTHKLLGLELSEAGRHAEALDELRSAERGGDPDARIPFHQAAALAALARPGEAADHYVRFLRGPACASEPRDALCGEAEARVRAANGE